MNYGCLSCGAKYSIPDSRVQKAGVDGLRVRCSRCRAIMAVSANMMASSSSSSSSSSSKKPKTTARDDVFAAAGASSSSAMSSAMSASSSPAPGALITGVMRNPFADVAAPAAMSSGGLESAAGVSREVTGIFMGLLQSAVDDDSRADGLTRTDRSGRPRADVYYAAIEGRARGPFTSREMLMLAEKGKVRAGTLLWKPGASGWKPLKHVGDFDVSFLLDAVRVRKRREREAEMLAERRLGIAPVRLERQTVRPLKPSSAQAPALPFDAFFDDADAGNLTGSSTGSSLSFGAGSELSSPSSWRAPETAGRPRPERVRAGFVVAAGVTVAFAAGAALVGFGLVSF